ncbi:SAUR-like auxin-responsive protein family [Gossypium australe]|uniref:SAUR-like auxin-responsive protein family n=1 Tax=Gossypium australe TaxID=47621 RepID=A0A5B6WKQ6_9ROSI|nr:SAUR-like auxin-responsive protein family [Gossypium australe]
MAIRLHRIISSKKVTKGYFAVYVGENQKRFVIPVSFLSQPLFQDLLGKSEEEFGYSHPTGGLTIPCNEDIFLDVTSRLNQLICSLATLIFTSSNTKVLYLCFPFSKHTSI